MKIPSWNVRGIGSARKRALIKEVIKKYDPDIVFIQESKRMEFNDRWARSVWKARGISWVAAPSWGASGGIVTMWNKDVALGMGELIGKYSVSLNFKQQEDGFVWVLTNVYGPNDNRERKELWEELADIRGLWDGPWCVGGEFNVIRFKEETNNTNQRVTTSMRKFNRFVDAFEIKEIPLSPKTFT
ncbi:PREDICTED: uncharacterized protein LOC104594028 [Nelumbo nucifera]|uniref:Uncharacterized protein LOC104594028 n=1 Tax=Nelumbo nucifera TaxID=4432 RepID=A0A1U7ZFG1_NELNU|nr:PREDICTED: uncharacterized protein LOC104594028 [Nelumbo nucifera]